MMVVLSAVVLFSCNREVIQDNSYGFLGISLSSDLSEEMVSKADGTADELVFSVDVLDASGRTVASRDDHRTVTAENPFKLQVGSYDVIARHGEDINAAFENPFYEGRTEQSLRVNANRTTSATITCTLANTIFSVEFPSEFSAFTDYEVAVTNGTGEKLVFSNNPQSGNPLEAGFDAKAYFAVTGTLTWELYLKNTDGGEYRATNTFTDVKARQHYHLKFELGEDETSDGGFVVRISLDNSWDDTSHDIVLDFYKGNMPVVAAEEGFEAVSGEPVSVPVGNTSGKELSFTALEGISRLRISHDNLDLIDRGLPQYVELIGASDALLSSLSNSGIVVTESIVKSIASDAQCVKVDMTGFIA